jgi:hypothetical protein
MGYQEAKWSKSTNQWCLCGGDMKWSSNNGVWSCGCPGSNELPTGYGTCDCAEGLSRKDYFAGDRTCKPCPDGSKPGALGLGCDCLKEGAQLVSVRGAEVCRCPPHLRDVGGKCVAPCPAGQTQTSFGTCCDTSRVTACGQCCSTLNCADERAPAPGRGLGSACCPPGQIKVAGGCGRPGGITRAGFVCPPSMVLSDNALDCTRTRRVSTPIRLPRQPSDHERAAIRPGATGSPGVWPGSGECPPGQIMINGRCVFPASGAGATRTQSGSPGVGPNKNKKCRNGERSCIVVRGQTGSPGVVNNKPRNNLDQHEFAPSFVTTNPNAGRIGTRPGGGGGGGGGGSAPARQSPAQPTGGGGAGASAPVFIPR